MLFLCIKWYETYPTVLITYCSTLSQGFQNKGVGITKLASCVCAELFKAADANKVDFL